MTSPKTVTVLGLGNMGTALAQALLRRGYRVTVWNRTVARADALVARGAVGAGSPAEALRASSLTIMCVLDQDASAAVLDAPGVKAAVRGRTLVQFTSGVPEDFLAQEDWVRSNGGRFLAGGIMAYPKDIGKPDTLILYSGDSDAFGVHRDVLLGLGGDIRYLGPDPRTAIALYLTSGLFMLGSLAMFLETAAVADAYGVSTSTYCDVSVDVSSVLTNRIRESSQRIAEGRLDGDEASIAMIAPTSANICRAFERTGVEPRMTAAFVKHLQAAAQEGRGQCDLAALFRRLARPQAIN